MKSLKYFGILVLPKYRAKGYVIISDKKTMQLIDDKAEEMAFAWCKKLGTPYVEDKVFRKNFFTDFCKELGIDYTEDFNFDQIIWAIMSVKHHKEMMLKSQKKRKAEERKKLREARKATHGYALVDGHEVEVANYIAEPSCIFMGRGKHPMRGRWKEGPRKEDITLNLSPENTKRSGFKYVWKPNKMWVARWTDKLSGKTKYVWLADNWGQKQAREKAKFNKARKLEKNLTKVYKHIVKNLDNKDWERLRLATASLLIFKMNIRVGDEKNEDEADTVGCLTLRPEHISFTPPGVTFDFIGKDSVHWRREIVIPIEGLVALRKCLNYDTNEPLFEGLNSKQITKFLSEVQEGLTAKVFRTYRATEAVREAMKEPKSLLKNPENFPEKIKKLHVKFDILYGSKVCNHKKAKSKNYEKGLEKKNAKIKKLLDRQVAICEGKKKGNIEKLVTQIAIATIEKEFFVASSEWNLSTSLKSYIDPRVMKSYLDRIDLPYDKIYSKALLKKFSWCFGGGS